MMSISKIETVIAARALPGLMYAHEDARGDFAEAVARRVEAAYHGAHAPTGVSDSLDEHIVLVDGTIDVAPRCADIAARVRKIVRDTWLSTHADAIAATIGAEYGDRLAAVREVHHAIEGPVLRAGLEAAGWTLHGAARELGCNVSAVRSALRRHPELEAERVRLGPVAPEYRRK